MAAKPFAQPHAAITLIPPFAEQDGVSGEASEGGRGFGLRFQLGNGRVLGETKGADRQQLIHAADHSAIILFGIATGG